MYALVCQTPDQQCCCFGLAMQVNGRCTPETKPYLISSGPGCNDHDNISDFDEHGLDLDDSQGVKVGCALEHGLDHVR